MVKPLPPGTVLQLMYLEERLRQLRTGRFIEIGPGAGEITELLLCSGWTGSTYDLDEQTIHNLQGRFAAEVKEGRLKAIHDNYLDRSAGPDADLVISCMVMEHMDSAQQQAFMAKAASDLRFGGRMIGLVPAAPRHWGIEDEIAGHYLRYTRSSLSNLMASNGWRLVHSAGLTFPLSNLLLPISNFLVARKEREKLRWSSLERTKLSGRRQVPFKTQFPSIFGLALNRVVLAPLHILQKVCSKSERALVLYFEAQPEGSDSAAHG